MGESITEGTITKWMKGVHDQVRADEVSVVIETDKVSVDIKASVSGVIVEKLADENVSVGQPIFKIDTSLTQSIAIDSQRKEAESPPARTESSAASVHVGSEAKARIPLIKFLGKRPKTRRLQKAAETGSADKTEVATAPTSIPTPKKKPIGVDFFVLKGGALFGRPVISEEEREAIESGGVTVFQSSKQKK